MMVRAWLAWVPLLAACAADTFVGSDGAAADSGTDAAPGPICGQQPCASGDTCCVASGDAGAQYACASSCPTQQNVAALSCTQTSDCPNGVCCMHQFNNVTSSQCEAQCGSSEVQLCDPSAPDPGCPAAQPCSTSNIQDWKLPQSFGTCGGLGVP